jgi:phosphoglycolate phosphatase
MRFSAVLFDLDGTLLDTLTDIADAANAVLGELGYPTHPKPAYRSMVGEGVRVLFERALPEGGRTERAVDRCAAGFADAYGRTWNIQTRPYDGIPLLLDQLMARGVTSEELAASGARALIRRPSELVAIVEG